MRRRKASPASRLRPFWILAIFIAILSAFAGYFVVTSPVFRPRAISVSSNRIVSRSDIVARAAIAGDRNIWMQNTRAMVSRIETIPYIATAAVHRHLDGTVSIDVTERIPFAVVETHGERAIVDRNLRVLQIGETADPRLPTFAVRKPLALEPGDFLKDATLQRLRDDDDALVAGGIESAALTTDKYGQLVATLRDGVDVLLGDDDDLAKKIPLVDPILSQLARAGRPIAALDLRAPGTPIVVYKK